MKTALAVLVALVAVMAGQALADDKGKDDKKGIDGSWTVVKSPDRLKFVLFCHHALMQRREGLDLDPSYHGVGVYHLGLRDKQP